MQSGGSRLGQSWGLAEETGFAVAWLIAHSLDGARLLCRHLQQAQHLTSQDMRPVVQANEWHAEHRDSLLCPITVGATISDYLCINPKLLHGDGLRMASVNFPGLLLPFIAAASDGEADIISVQSDDIVVYFNGNSPPCGDVGAFMQLACADLEVWRSKTYPRPLSASAEFDDAAVKGNVKDGIVRDENVRDRGIRHGCRYLA